jgi:hypothetical protein
MHYKIIMGDRALNIPVDLNGVHPLQFILTCYISLYPENFGLAVETLVAKLKSKAWKPENITAVLANAHQMLGDDRLRDAIAAALLDMVTSEPSGGAS